MPNRVVSSPHIEEVVGTVAAGLLAPAHALLREHAWGTLACRHLYLCSPFFPQLLDYVMTTLLFSDKNVDSNLITWNRVVLLHGKARGVPCHETNCVTKGWPIPLSLGKGL